MIWYSAFLLVVGVATALPSQKLHPLSDEYIQQINNKHLTWKAGRNFEIHEYELFKTLASGVKKSNATRVPRKIHNEAQAVPDSFDSREAWSNCADIIGLIRDQSRCGSCWAFAAVEAMSDRICIHSDASRKLMISSQDLVSCGNVGGCDGGWPADAFGVWVQDGIVTGGLYGNTAQGCKSYFLPPCDDHPHQCTNYVDTPDCSEVCDDSSLNYYEQKTYGKDLGEVYGEKQIQLEILNNGPIEATMDVYPDFANYKSGIYQLSTSDEALGGHAIKILGWGVENGVKYWLVANSWNERWGENGYFRIIRGQDEVGIEDSATFALPDFSRF